MSQISGLEPPAQLAETTPITDYAHAVTPLPLSKEERQAVAAVRDLIEQQPQDTFLARVEEAIEADKAAPPAQADTNQAVRRQALRAWWYFGQGLDAGGARNMEEALRCYRRAAYEFARLGDNEPLEEAIGYGIVSEASLRIQQQKFAEGEKLLDDAYRFFENSSSIGRQQRERLAGIELEARLQQGLQAARSGNPVQAEQLLRSAAQRVNGLAASRDDDDPLRGMYIGTAGLLQAQAACMAGFRAISLYDFDDIAKGESAAAAKAAEFLAERSPANAALAAFYSQILAILEGLAAIMLRVLSLSFRTEKGGFRELHERVNAARKSIPAAAGADPVPLAQGCDQLNQWLNNLERLAKPSKKDLGVYGGFVACATFCVLLLVIAVVNKAFSLGATATVVFTTCTPLALVAGFGLAGLRAWQGSKSSDGASPSGSKA